jgi:hypothetical protein
MNETIEENASMVNLTILQSIPDSALEELNASGILDTMSDELTTVADEKDVCQFKIYPVGYIYQIVNVIDDLKYVGSTINDLNDRLAGHFRVARRNGTQPICKYMREIGFDYFSIELLEQTGPTTRLELRKLEHKYIMALNTVLHGLNGKYEDQHCCHGAIRSRCVPCHGGSVCEHNRQRHRCTKCHGNGVCAHNKVLGFCTSCPGGGTWLCAHKSQKSNCTICKGSGVCDHERIRYYCHECKGGGTCSHGTRKSICNKCSDGGQQLCGHGTQRALCIKCPGGGGALCGHINKNGNPSTRKDCAICNPCPICIIAGYQVGFRMKHMKNAHKNYKMVDKRTKAYKTGQVGVYTSSSAVS